MTVKLMMLINSICEKVSRKLKEKKGQNTVEYLLMLTVIVGVVLLVGGIIKKFFPQLLEKIKAAISGAAGSLSSGS